MNAEDTSLLAGAAAKKAALFKRDIVQYFFRALMAGFFIDAAMIFSNVVNTVFAESQPQWGKFLGAIVFSIAVLLICLVGGELFTGNNLVMAFGSFSGTVSWADTGKIWLVSYLGNFAGCALLALIFAGAGASGTANTYASFIPGKLSIPAGPLFCRAILCNFFVCLGVLCGIKLKNEAAKILMITLCVSAFVISGFEHSIANMGNFITAALLLKNLSLTAVLRSMLIVTAGNMAGGALLLALPLKLMSERMEDKA